LFNFWYILFISGISKEHVYFISYLYFMSIEHIRFIILNILSNIRFDLITQILDLYMRHIYWSPSNWKYNYW